MKINRISTDKHPYLQIVSTIAKAPEKLHFIGKLPTERITSVAIVGTRKPTSYGKEVTYQLAYDLAKKGIVIVSGLALGVDAIAHKAALDAGGKTIAVLANGLDTVYPATNKQLADKIIASGGAIISEYEPGVSARGFQFLARNRIVSGLSDMVVVTEAAARSGTLATVTYALDQGKEVGAVPGNITGPLSYGCNQLIKQGAHVILSTEDILNIVSPSLVDEQVMLHLGSNELETKIIELIKQGVRDGDELARGVDCDVIEFTSALTMLEINGIVRALGGNQWALK